MAEISVNKRILAGLVLLVAFMFAVATYTDIASKADSPECTVNGVCPHEQQLNFINSAIPFIVSISVVAGAGVYYLMSQRVESKQKSLRKNVDVLLAFLSSDERKLVNLLMENGGKVLQAEVTRLPGMTKVKSHRVVQRMVDRGVIEKDSLGKTNVIRFTKEIREGML